MLICMTMASCNANTERSATHRFVPIRDDPKTTNQYCDLTIKVVENKYEDIIRDGVIRKKGDTFYYITYTYNYGEHPDSRKCHPFYGNKRLYTDYSDGEIIVKNKISEAQIDYLLMPMDKLAEFTGNTCARQYIIIIMKQITLAWD